METKLISIVLKLIGLAIISLSIIHAFGIYTFPSAGLAKTWEVLIAFGIGVTLFIVPVAVLEKKIEKKIDDLSDKN